MVFVRSVNDILNDKEKKKDNQPALYEDINNSKGLFASKPGCSGVNYMILSATKRADYFKTPDSNKKQVILHFIIVIGKSICNRLGKQKANM